MLRLAFAVLLASAAMLSLPGQVPTQQGLQPSALGAQAVGTALPTAVSGRYAVAGSIEAVGRAGSTVYAGGTFSRIAARTGSAIVVPASGSAPEPVRAEVAGGSVRAAVPDGSGGWYLGGSFTSVGGLPRAALARLRTDRTLDPDFAPDDLGQVRALALRGSVLYVGGAGPTPVVRVLDAATGATLPATFAPLPEARGVTAILGDADRVYVAFGDAGVAAYDAGGRQVWAHPIRAEQSHDEGVRALALTGERLLVGGKVQDAGSRNLLVLDAGSGTPTGRRLDVPRIVEDIAVVGGRVFLAHPVLRGGVEIVDLGTGARRSWADIQATRLAASEGTLYVAGRTVTEVWYTERVYAARAGSARATLRPVSPALAGFTLALAPQDGRLLVGGTFTGAGGVARRNLAAFDARTGLLRAWRPSPDQGVRALAVWRDRVYFSGDFTRVSGLRRAGFAAVRTDGRGRLLPWRPRLAPSSMVWTLAVSRGRVFVGGSFRLPGQKPGPSGRFPSLRLAAFSASGAGSRLGFSPRVGSEVGALAVWRDKLVVGGYGSVFAVPVVGDGKPEVWRHSTNGPVFALATRGTTLYAGGRFSKAGGQPRKNLAAFALDRRGALLPWATRIPLVVQALAPIGSDLVFAGPAGYQSRQALGAVAQDGRLSPWRIDMPKNDYPLWASDPWVVNGGVSDMTLSSGRLFVAGGFEWLGPTGRQAAGGIGWLS